jgi:glyoxylase-like metal-dependent hydrolase (beta-lactamase superfamily II)
MSPSFWSPLVVFAALGATQPALEVREVAPGVYAVLQPKPGRFDDSNSAVIVTDEGVVVVDTQAAPAGARAVLARLRTLTPLPVETVINTHWHSDHVGGNSVYREAYPAVRLLAHRHTREDVLSRAIPDHREELETLPARLEAAEQQLVTGLRRDGGELTDADRLELREAIDGRRAYLEQARELEFVLPDAVFDERVTLHRGETEIRLLHFPGHTRGDVVVFLPLERVLIPGDLLDDLPFTGHGSPAALVRTLRALEELDFDLVITDIEMPNLDGIGLIQRVRAEPRWKRLPVIVLSTRGSAEDKRRALDAGANAYLVKTEFSENALREVLARHVEVA